MALNPVQRNYENLTSKNRQFQTEITENSRSDLNYYRRAIIRESAGSAFFLVLFGLLSWLVFSNISTNLDNNTLNWAATTINPVFDAVLGFFTTTGGFGGVGVMAVLLGIFFLWRRQISNLLLLTFSVGGGMLLDSVLKIFFQRPRPDTSTEAAHLTSFSYPSGHAMASACFFGFLIWLSFQFNWRPAVRTAWTIAMLFIILMVGISRIYLVEHYLTDVIGGFLLAAFWLLAVLGAGYKLFQLWQIRRLNRSATPR